MRVTLLTQISCELCEHARAVLDRLSADFELEITTVAFDSPAGEELAQRGGLLFAPGLYLDGEPFSHGRVSERRLRRELDRRAARCEPR